MSRSANWRIYRLPGATGLITGSGARPSDVHLGANTVSFWAPAGGSYTIRIRYSPYWRGTSGVCLSPTGDGMMTAHVPGPERVSLTMPDPLDAVVSAGCVLRRGGRLDGSRMTTEGTRPAAMRVLILSAPVGAGHNAAAAALAAELGLRGHEVEIVDGLELIGVERLVVHGYRFQILHAAWSWRMLYRAARLRFVIRVAGTILCRRARRLEQLIASSQPDLIVSTYPLVSAALAGLRRRARLPQPTATLVTDFDPHPGWVHRVLDQNLLVGEAHAGGICVRPPVGEAAAAGDAGALWQELGLSPTLRTVLIVGGAWGVGNLGRAAEAVLRVDGTQVIVVAGHNERLRRDLERTLDPARSAVLGFTARLGELMSMSGALIQNAGGMTCLEAFACGLPVIMFDPLPGHGEVNVRRMVGAGVVVSARSPAHLTELIAAPEFWDTAAVESATAARARFVRVAAADVLEQGSIVIPRQPGRTRRGAPFAIAAVVLACWLAAEPRADSRLDALIAHPHRSFAPLPSPDLF